MENPQSPLGGPATTPPLPLHPGKRTAGLRFEDLGRLLYTHNPFYAISAVAGLLGTGKLL